MNKREWKERVAALKKELAELENNPPKREPWERWKPESGDIYWCVDERCEPSRFAWDNDSYDNAQLDNFNIFQTEEEAEFQAERTKIMWELDLWAVDEVSLSNEHYGIFCDSNGEIRTTLWLQEYLPHVFKTREVAKQAIRYIGEDRLKKYYFKVVD